MMPVAEKNTVKMKFVGHFKGTERIVQLPIPLISNSMKLDESLTFKRTTKTGAAYCEVPLEWAGALLAVGGNWQMDEPMTDDLKHRIASEHDKTKTRMKKWAIENDVVME